MKKILLSLIIAIIIIMGLAPAVTGYFFKKNYFAFIDNLNANNSAKITITRYDTGWFSSHVTLSVIPPINSDLLGNSLPGQNPNTVTSMATLTIEQTIMHGPIIYNSARHRLSVGLGEAHSTVHFSSALETLLFGAPKTTGVAIIDSTMKFNGDWMNHIQIAPLTIPLPMISGQITWQGLKGTTYFKVDGNNLTRLKTNLTLGALTATLSFGQPIEFSLQPIHQIADTTRQPMGLWTGKSNVSFPALSLKTGGQLQFGLQKFSAKGDSNLSENDYQLSNSLTIEKIEIPGYTIPVISPLKLALSIKNLNARELANFAKASRDTSFSQLTGEERSKLVESWFPRFLTATSQLNLDLSMNTSLGDMLLKGEAQWPSNTALPTTLDDIEKNGQAKVDIKMAAPLANLIMEQVVNYFAAELARQMPTQTVSPTTTETPEMGTQTASSNKKIFSDKVANMMQGGELSLNAAIQVMSLYDARVTPPIFTENIKHLELTPGIEMQLVQLYTQLNAASNTPGTAQTMPSQSQTNTTQLQQQMSASMKSQFDQLVQQGYIIKDNNDYVTSITYEHNMVKVNGKDITPLMGSPSQSPPLSQQTDQIQSK